MKPSRTYIEADQGYIRWQEQKRAKAERNSIIRFALLLLVVGIWALYISLQIVAHTPINHIN